jgi:hypothetical protein
MVSFTSLGRSGGGVYILVCLLLCPVSAHAAPLITLGTYDLQPNMAGQNINIYVGGGDGGITNVDLTITTGDGGPSVALLLAQKGQTGTNHIVAPTVSFVNLLATGALFANNNNGIAIDASGSSTNTPQFYALHTATSSGTVNLQGTFTDPVSGRTDQALLAVVTIDTTGFFSGSYNISVDGTVDNGGVQTVINGTAQDVATQATDFPPELTSQVNHYSGFTDGVIIVPEPASLGLLGLVFPVLLLRRRRSLTDSSSVVHRSIGVRI